MLTRETSLPRILPRRSGLLFLTFALVAFTPLVMAEEPRSKDGKLYSTTGVVTAISKGEVEIAHDDIPGFMSAMTMTFELPNAKWVSDIRATDSVEFSFRSTADGRRVLTRIRKRSIPKKP